MVNKIINKKIYMLDLVLLPFILIFPILSLPLIILEIIIRKKVDYKLIIVIGIMSYLYIPTQFDDLGRIYYSYDNTYFFNFKEIFRGKDFFLNLIIFYKEKFYIKKELLPLVAAILFYGQTFKIFSKIIESKKKKNFIFLATLVFINLLPRIIITKVRMPISIAILMVSVYKIVFENKNKAGIIYSIISSMVHYSSVLYVFVLTLLSNKRLNSLLVKFFKISVLFYLISPTILYNILSRFPIPEKYTTSIYTYTLGIYGIGIEKGTNRIIYDNLYNIITYLNMLYLFFFRGESKLNKLSKGIWVFGNLFNSIPNLFFRFTFLPKILTVLVMVEEYSKKDFKRKIYIKIYFILSLILFLLTLYIMRESIYNSWVLKYDYSIFQVIEYNVSLNELIKK